MIITPEHSKEICRLIVALQLISEKVDAEYVDTLRDASFYLMELSVKNAYPDAQSLIEATS